MEQEEDLAKARGWHLEVQKRDWIIWGYGPEHGSYHIDQANSIIDFGPPIGTMIFPFELSPVKGLPSPRVYDRVHTWGWRLRSNRLTTETGWMLVESKEQAIHDARKHIETTWTIRNSERPMFFAALDDVREKIIEDEPGPSPRQWNPTKKKV